MSYEVGVRVFGLSRKISPSSNRGHSSKRLSLTQLLNGVITFRRLRIYRPLYHREVHIIH